MGELESKTVDAALASIDNITSTVSDFNVTPLDKNSVSLSSSSSSSSSCSTSSESVTPVCEPTNQEDVVDHFDSVIVDVIQRLHRKQLVECFQLRGTFNDALITPPPDRKSIRRLVVIDCLLSYCRLLEHTSEIFERASFILDRFVTVSKVQDVRDLQLIMDTALCIADKLHATYNVSIRDYCQLNCTKSDPIPMHTKKQMRVAEVRIGQTLNWRFHAPLIHDFLSPMCAGVDDLIPETTDPKFRDRLRALAFYFHVCLLSTHCHFEFFPSTCAGVCYYTALCHLLPTAASVWTPTMIFYTDYNTNELIIQIGEKLIAYILHNKLTTQEEYGIRWKHVSKLHVSPLEQHPFAPPQFSDTKMTTTTSLVTVEQTLSELVF